MSKLGVRIGIKISILSSLESESCSVMSASLRLHGLYSPWNSLGQNTGVGNHSFLQGIFPTQGLNPGLPYCRWILYQLNHQGSPRILEPLSSLRSWAQVEGTQGFLPHPEKDLESSSSKRLEA